MIPWWGWLVGVGVVGLALRPRTAAAALDDADDTTGWVQMQDAPGLAIRAPSRSWTSPAVRAVLLRAGKAAAKLGGQLQVGDIGPAERGTPFDPHKSHRWGRDMDIAYTFETYPTPIEVPVDERVAAVLESIADDIEVVGANEARVGPLLGHGFKVSAWDGHNRHLHLRLRSSLVAQPAGFVAEGDIEEDND